MLMFNLVMYWFNRFLWALFYCMLINATIRFIFNFCRKSNESEHAAVLQAATRRKLSMRNRFITPPRYYKKHTKSASVMTGFKED